MTRVTIDATTAAKLTAIADQEIVLCDEAGNVVGWYAPARPRPTMRQVIDSCPTSEQELQRRLEEEKDSGRCWAEIRKDLESQ